MPGYRPYSFLCDHEGIQHYDMDLPEVYLFCFWRIFLLMNICAGF